MAGDVPAPAGRAEPVRRAGVAAARYVATARVEAARRELESSDDTVAAIAARVGFGTAESMRRTFVRDLGAPPDDYRRRFAHHRKDQR